MHVYENQSLSAWADMSHIIRDGKPVLIFHIHGDVMTDLAGIQWSTTPIIETYQKRLNVGLFIAPHLNQPWGFGEVLKSCPPTLPGDWKAWEIELPEVAKADEAAEHCKAKEAEADELYRRMLMIRATVSLFRYKAFVKPEKLSSENPIPQLIDLYVEVPLQPDAYRGSGALQIGLTKQTVEWLNNGCTKAHIEIIEREMRAVNAVLCRVNRNNRFGFDLRRGSLYIHIPGDAAYIGAEDYQESQTESYCLYPHNLDSSSQQLTLLCAVGTMCRLIREGK